MTNRTQLDTIDSTNLAHITGGLVSGDGGCVRPLPPWPFPTKLPSSTFDPTKIQFPTTAANDRV
jgi:hypothetical protein